MNKQNETEFIEAICQHLDLSISELDKTTSVRLERMRELALSGLEQDKLARKVREQLNSEAAVPPEIEERLDSIRAQAMAKLHSSQNEISEGGYWQRLLDAIRSMTPAIPVQLVATACIVLTATSLVYLSSRPSGPLTLEDEIGLVASADELELYENLEFYLWLADAGLPN